MAPAGSTYRWLNESNGRIDPNLPISTQQRISSGGGGNNNGPSVSTGNGFRRTLVQNANGNFTITQAIPFPYTIYDDTQPPSDACSSFTEGAQVAYRAVGDPNVKVVVRQRGACKYAVWSDGSEDMPYDWMPYVNTIGNFTKADMRQCLKFNSEPCGARMGVAEPGSEVIELGLRVAPTPAMAALRCIFRPGWVKWPACG